jgi:hypothetical protein
MCKLFRHRGISGPKLLFWSGDCKGHHASTRYEEPVTTTTGQGIQRDEVNAWQASKGLAFVSVPMIVAARNGIICGRRHGTSVGRSERRGTASTANAIWILVSGIVWLTLTGKTGGNEVGTKGVFLCDSCNLSLTANPQMSANSTRCPNRLLARRMFSSRWKRPAQSIGLFARPWSPRCPTTGLPILGRRGGRGPSHPNGLEG